MVDMLAFDDGRCRVHVGHVLEELAALPADSVHCVVTSPPYWGLRDYKGLPDFTWGGEPACAHEWAAEPRIRTGGPHGNGVMLAGGRAVVEAQAAVKDRGAGAFCACGAWRGQLGLEPTPDIYVAHMVEVFEAVRRVLRPDGTCWLNLGDCYATGAGKVGDRPGGGDQGDRARGIAVMTQPNRMPIPGLKPKDLVGIPWRVAFALQAAGWWLRSDIVWAKPNPMPESVTDRPTRSHEYLFLLAKSERYYYDAEAIKEPTRWPDGPNAPDKIKSPYGQGFTRRADKQADTGLADPGGPDMTKVGFNDRWNEAKADGSAPTGRNKRSVWTISTAPYPEAHFATFPPDLVRPCVLAGTAAEGIVLDPFLGSGTTLEVAASLGRRGVGIEGNPTYLPLIEKRLQQGVLL